MEYKRFVSAAKAGDTASIYSLYKSSFRAVWAELAAERQAPVLVREAFVASFKNLGRLDYPEEFPAWMKEIAAHYRRHYSAAAPKSLPCEKEAGSTTAGTEGLPGAETPSIPPNAELMNSIWEDVLRCLRGEAPQLSANPGAAEDAAPEWDIESDLEAIELMARVGAKRARRKKLTLAISALTALALCAGVVLYSLANPTRGSRYSFPNLLTSLSDEKMMRFAYAISGQLAGQIGEVYQISDNQYYLVIYLNGDAAGSAVVSYDEAKEAAQAMVTGTAILTGEQLKAVAEDPYMQLSFGSLPKDRTAADIAATEAGSTELEPEADGNFDLHGSDMEHLLDKAIREKERVNELFGLPEGGEFSVTLKIRCRNVDFSAPVTVRLDSSVAEMLGTQGDLQIVLGDEMHTIFLTKQQLQSLCEAYGSIAVQLKAQSSRVYDIAFYDAEGAEIDQLYGDMDFTLPADSSATYVYARYKGGSENRGGMHDERLGTITFPVYLSGTYALIGNQLKLFDAEGLSEEELSAAQFVAERGFFKLYENAKGGKALATSSGAGLGSAEPEHGAEGAKVVLGSESIYPEVSLLQDGYFRPYEQLTRGELVEIMGRMFFLTDDSSESSFTDIDKQSPAYAFIAAGQDSEILSGLSDGSFGAELPCTRESLITLCARTMVHRGAAEYPKASANTSFLDASEINEYAAAAVALALEQGLIDEPMQLQTAVPGPAPAEAPKPGQQNEASKAENSLLRPQDITTRIEAAVILTRMYRKLYQ